MLYLDYAASGPLRPCALETLTKSMAEDFANPSSAHSLGKGLHRRIESCRQTFLKLLGAKFDDLFIFTSSATESNNMVIEGIGLKPGDTVLVSYADHPSVTVPMERLKRRDINVKEIPLHNDGRANEPELLRLIDDSTKLVILSLVNNQSGAITDVSKLSREIKKLNRNTIIHVDAAQGFGKIPFSISDGMIDGVSISSHKFGGPKGVAGLYWNHKIHLSPLLIGGGQEYGMRSSTQAAPLIYSFCEAAKDAIQNLNPSLEYVTKLYHRTIDLIKEKIDTAKFPFISSSSPYILTFLLPGISSDIILRHLEQAGIMISSTSACSSKSKEANPVFDALHLPPDYHNYVLRVSFVPETTTEDLDFFCNTLSVIYNELKRYLNRR